MGDCLLLATQLDSHTITGTGIRTPSSILTSRHDRTRDACARLDPRQ